MQEIELPDGQIVEFPDEMPFEQVDAIVQRDFQHLFTAKGPDVTDDFADQLRQTSATDQQAAQQMVSGEGAANWGDWRKAGQSAMGGMIGAWDSTAAGVLDRIGADEYANMYRRRADKFNTMGDVFKDKEASTENAFNDIWASVKGEAPDGTMGKLGRALLQESGPTLQGLGAGLAGGAAAKALGVTAAAGQLAGSVAGKIAAPWLSTAVGGAIRALPYTVPARVAESLVEAEEAFTSSLAEGVGEDRAREISNKVLGGNMTLAGWDSAQAALLFAGLPGFAQTALQKLPLNQVMKMTGTALFNFAKFSGASVLEGQEEAYQAEVQEWAKENQLDAGDVLAALSPYHGHKEHAMEWNMGFLSAGAHAMPTAAFGKVAEQAKLLDKNYGEQDLHREGYKVDRAKKLLDEAPPPGRVVPEALRDLAPLGEDEVGLPDGHDYLDMPMEDLSINAEHEVLGGEVDGPAILGYRQRLRDQPAIDAAEAEAASAAAEKKTADSLDDEYMDSLLTLEAELGRTPNKAEAENMAGVPAEVAERLLSFDSETRYSLDLDSGESADRAVELASEAQAATRDVIRSGSKAGLSSEKVGDLIDTIADGQSVAQIAESNEEVATALEDEDFSYAVDQLESASRAYDEFHGVEAETKAESAEQEAAPAEPALKAKPKRQNAAPAPAPATASEETIDGLSPEYQDFNKIERALVSEMRRTGRRLSVAEARKALRSNDFSGEDLHKSKVKASLDKVGDYALKNPVNGPKVVTNQVDAVRALREKLGKVPTAKQVVDAAPDVLGLTRKQATDVLAEPDSSPAKRRILRKAQRLIDRSIRENVKSQPKDTDSETTAEPVQPAKKSKLDRMLDKEPNPTGIPSVEESKTEARKAEAEAKKAESEAELAALEVELKKLEVAEADAKAQKELDEEVASKEKEKAQKEADAKSINPKAQAVAEGVPDPGVMGVKVEWSECPFDEAKLRLVGRLSDATLTPYSNGVFVQKEGDVDTFLKDVDAIEPDDAGLAAHGVSREEFNRKMQKGVRGVRGSFNPKTNLVVIELSNGLMYGQHNAATVGTLGHEDFHFAMKYALSTKGRAQIIKRYLPEALKKAGIKGVTLEQAMKDPDATHEGTAHKGYDVRWYGTNEIKAGKTYSNGQLLQMAEEAAADAYGYWNPAKGGLFTKINNFFVSLTGARTTDSMFRDIREGKGEFGENREVREGGAALEVNLEEHDSGVSLQQRRRIKTVRLNEADMAKVRSAAVQAKVPVRAVSAAVKEKLAAFPVSDGWERVSLKKIKVTKSKNGGISISIDFVKIPYSFHLNPGETRAPMGKKGVAHRAARTDLLASAMLSEIEEIIQINDGTIEPTETITKDIASVIHRQRKWYSNMVSELHNRFGSYGDFFAELLGSLSPNTAVDQNWDMAVESLIGFAGGEFDHQLKQLEIWLSEGNPISKFPKKYKIKKVNDTLFGMNSSKAMMAMLDQWKGIKPGDKPKAKNFAQNLSGRSFKATIDVWAARNLNRLGGKKTIPPGAEGPVAGGYAADGVTTSQTYGYAEDTYQKVFNLLEAGPHAGTFASPADIQAFIWFREKILWTQKGWTTQAGRGGSFELKNAKDRLSRWIVGVTAFQSNPETDLANDIFSGEQINAQVMMRGVLRTDPMVVASKAHMSYGGYDAGSGIETEPSLDVEAIVRPGYQPNNLVATTAEVAIVANQTDVFISRVLEPGEDSPNARPGVEITLAAGMTMSDLQPLLKNILEKGAGGFSLGVDPREDHRGMEYRGAYPQLDRKHNVVRVQWIPEIQARIDDEFRAALLEDPEAATAAALEKAIATMKSLTEIVKTDDNVHSVEYNKYDTLNLGKEVVHEYTNPGSNGNDRGAGGRAWFGRPLSANAQAAAQSISEGLARQRTEGEMAGPDAERRLSLSESTGEDLREGPGDNGRRFWNFTKGDHSAEGLQRQFAGSGSAGAERGRYRTTEGQLDPESAAIHLYLPGAVPERKVVNRSNYLNRIDANYNLIDATSLEAAAIFKEIQENDGLYGNEAIDRFIEVIKEKGFDGMFDPARKMAQLYRDVSAEDIAETTELLPADKVKYTGRHSTSERLLSIDLSQFLAVPKNALWYGKSVLNSSAFAGGPEVSEFIMELHRFWNERNLLGPGFYFSIASENAQYYADQTPNGKVHEVFLKVERPLNLDHSLSKEDQAAILMGVKATAGPESDVLIDSLEYLFSQDVSGMEILEELHLQMASSGDAAYAIQAAGFDALQAEQATPGGGTATTFVVWDETHIQMADTAEAALPAPMGMYPEPYDLNVRKRLNISETSSEQDVLIAQAREAAEADAKAFANEMRGMSESDKSRYIQRRMMTYLANAGVAPQQRYQFDSEMSKEDQRQLADNKKKAMADARTFGPEFYSLSPADQRAWLHRREQDYAGKYGGPTPLYQMDLTHGVSYESASPLSRWFMGKDHAFAVNSIEARNFQKELKLLIGEKSRVAILGSGLEDSGLIYGKEARDWDRAMHIYIDLKRDWSAVDEYYSKLTPEQKRITDLALKIRDGQAPDGVAELADKIEESYRLHGLEAVDSGIISNVVDNYVNRSWKLAGERQSMAAGQTGFNTGTGHSKRRVLKTILEGWAAGHTLKVEGATANLNILKDEIARVREDQALISRARRMRIASDDPDSPFMITHRVPRGMEKDYVLIDHPNFTYWMPTRLIEGTEQTEKTQARPGTFSTQAYAVYREMSPEEISKRLAKNPKWVQKAVSTFDTEEDAARFVEDNTTEKKNFYVRDRTQVWEKQQVYGHKASIGDRMNKILVGRHAGKGWETALRINATIKSWILATSFFHHMAYMRSFYLGTQGRALSADAKFSETGELIQGTELGRMGLRAAYTAGNEMIENMNEELMFLIDNGLTIGSVQDFDESVVNRGFDSEQSGVLGWAREARARQTNFLFKRFGAGLKAQSALIEFRRALKHRPNADPVTVAQDVGRLINEDFGGLHLDRMGVNHRTRRWTRLLLLAPDWTGSNALTLKRMFFAGENFDKGTPEQRAMYRGFWGGVIAKGVIATVVLNAILAGFDDDDDRWASRIMEFKENFKGMRWLGVDVTPIYIASAELLDALPLGFEVKPDDRRRYFSIFGHFADPLKWSTSLTKASHNKGSPLYRALYGVYAGVDWKGDGFTDLSEWLGTDEKGYYKTTADGHRAGDPKGGQNKFQLTKRDADAGPLSWGQIPVWLMHTAVSSLPIQVQELLGMATGENDIVDSLGRAAGIHSMRGKGSQFEQAAMKIQAANDKLDELRSEGSAKEAAVFRRESPALKFSARLTNSEKAIRLLKKRIKTYEASTKFTKAEREEKVRQAEDRIREIEQSFMAYYRGNS